jgi:hypothetical protein
LGITDVNAKRRPKEIEKEKKKTKTAGFPVREECIVVWS